MLTLPRPLVKTVRRNMPPTPKKVSPMIKAKTRTLISRASDRIQQMQFDEEDGIKILLYGRSGTGKTTLWATFPKPILSIICSGSTKPGELRSVNTPENREQIDTVVLHNSEELRDLIEDIATPGTLRQYGTIVLDHASGYQDLVLRDILGLEEIPAQKSWGLATQQQYGQCAMQVKESLRALLGLNTNVVIIAQEREFKDEGNSDSLVMPTVGAGLTPSIAGWLYTAVDYICNTFIRQKEIIKSKTVGVGKTAKTIDQVVKTGEVEYCLRTGADAVYTTKFRLPRGTPLPQVLVDPSYDKIIALVNGMPTE
jgi:energy-coupling factor transporter ATP-binding protein EcfA2